jgi:hypothetical protein
MLHAVINSIASGDHRKLTVINLQCTDLAGDDETLASTGESSPPSFSPVRS